MIRWACYGAVAVGFGYLYSEADKGTWLSAFLLATSFWFALLSSHYGMKAVMETLDDE